MKKRKIFFVLAMFFLLCGSTLAVAQDYGNDILVVVFDDSGSMDDAMPGGMRKIDAGKIALKTMINQLSENTKIGLLSFHRGWIYDVAMIDKKKLLALIDRITPLYGTPLSEFIKKGADRILIERKKQLGLGSTRLLVMTDGKSTDGDGYVAYSRDIISRGIILDTIGVGMVGKHALAALVHTYYKADNPEQLQIAVKKVAGEIGGKDSKVNADEVFAVIGSLPDSFVKGVINALQNPGDYPIGERPPITK